MKPFDDIPADGKHLTEEEVALWVEAIAGDRLAELPAGLKDHVEQCELCREMVAENAALLIPSMEMKNENIRPTAQLEQEPGNRFFILRIAAVGIILLIVGALLYHYLRSDSPGHKDLYALYFTPYPDLITSKGITAGEPDEDHLLPVAMNYYAEGRYDSALVILAYLWAGNPDNDTLQFYMGVSMLAAETELNTAKRIFANLTESHGVFKVQAQWYLAMLWLKEDNVPECLKALKPLLHGDDYYRKKAEELTRELKH